MLFTLYIIAFLPAFTESKDGFDGECLEVISKGKEESVLKAINLVTKPRLVNVKENGDIFLLDSRLIGPEEFTVYSADPSKFKEKVDIWSVSYGLDPSCKKQNSNLTICYESIKADTVWWQVEDSVEMEYLKKKCGKLDGILIKDKDGKKFQVFSTLLGKVERVWENFVCYADHLCVATQTFVDTMFNVAYKKDGTTFQVHGGGPDCCPLNLTVNQNFFENGHSKCLFVWKVVKVCLTQQQEVQVCDYTYKVGYAPKVTDEATKENQFGKLDMGLSISEAGSKIVAEIKNKFENEFDTTQKIDDTVEYLKEHADYGQEDERTGKLEIPAYYSFDVEIRQLVYRCYGVEAQTDIVDTFTDDPVKLENVLEREQQLKEAVGINEYYCQ